MHHIISILTYFNYSLNFNNIYIYMCVCERVFFKKNYNSIVIIEEWEIWIIDVLKILRGTNQLSYKTLGKF